MHLHQPDRPRRVAPLRLGAGREQPTQHLVGGPAHGGDGGDAQPLVHLGASGVVDAGHHVVHVEGLAHHPGGEDVGVVAVGDSCECLGPVDPGLGEHLAVEADALDGLTVEVGTQPPESLDGVVDDGDGVTALLQAPGQGGAHTAAAHDHDVHGHESRVTRTCSGPRPPEVRVPHVNPRSRSPSACSSAGELRSTQLGETLLPKRIALPVFASDALSSVAYAPDEILLTLSLAGLVAYGVLLEDRHPGRRGDAGGRRLVPAERARLPLRRR